MKPILIVDDEAPIRALIRLTLERAGYTCDEAATGTEAADKIEANTYDLALLDIMLPGPDGYELLDYLRSVQTPVIFLTAKTAVADRVRGLHLGADDYITKPFEPTELVARVGSYLQAITEQNSLACAAYSVDGTSLYYALPTAVPLSEVEALLAQDGEPRMVLANNHTLLCAGTVVLPERCITLVIAQDAAPVWQARQARTRNALIVELLAMVLAGGLVLLLCRRMTRPLEQLEQASRQIAAGAYSQRTAIHGSDEIASLSRSFDEMAQAVEGTVQTLQQNARQKDDFVAAFTHELKTPMTSILGFADILRSGEVSPATRRTAADYIYHESKRLEALSGNLLALMGLEQQPPQLEAVPLGRVLQSLRRALPQGSPVPTLPRSDAVVLAQPELLCDMLYNLIQNARKATPADGKVEVLLDETPTRLTIRVQDTGCGIPPQELARITEPFYMVDKSRAREQGGSGMGLALCARIAALHGTTLQFASVPSQGTTVSFCLQKAGSQPEVEP